MITPTGGNHPRSRQIWGIWVDERLHLSIGSPAIARLLEHDPKVAVPHDSGTDVVILEGAVVGPTEDAGVIGAYNEKYEWQDATDEYGPLTSIAPTAALAWRSAGWAGREGFQQAGRWRFNSQRKVPF